MMKLAGMAMPLAALVISGMFAVHASAAYPPVPGNSGVSASCPAPSPGASCAVTAHFADQNNTPLIGAPVTFAVHTIPGASISPTATTTDSNGNATATLAVGNGCGSDTVTATSGDVTLQTVVVVACSGAGLGSLPAASPLVSGPAPELIVGAAAAVLLLLGGAAVLLFRRRAASGGR